MNTPDTGPSPSEALLARLLAELDQTPRTGREAVVDRYLRDHPEHGDAIRDLVDVDAGVRRTPHAGGAGRRRLHTGERLGPFRVVRFVAQGGMGEVYEAVQDVLNRRVALKVIRNGFVSPTARNRFDREQQVLARLHYTNIVPVHQAGEADDLQYCAMQFVEGASLHRVVTELYQQETSAVGARQTPPIKELVGSLIRTATAAPSAAAIDTTGPDAPAPSQTIPAPSRLTLSPSYFVSAAEVMIQVAEAIQYGHDQGYCHRDIKPSNLIIDPEETCWVIDYGLAGPVHPTAPPEPPDETADPKLTHGPVGTPQYMAPEQFDGKSDARSDVWSLGVTLYELLTLRPAFRGDGWAELKELVMKTEPADPRTLVRNVPADLVAIYRKAMVKNPSGRYQTARELADDLKRWLHWEPTKARPARITLRPLRLWAWRNKAWAVTAAAVLAALIGGLVVESVHAEERKQQLVELQKQQERERAVVKSQQIQLGERSAGWSHDALTLLEAANRIRQGDDLRDHAAATLAGLDAKHIYVHALPFPATAGKAGVGRVAFSPDGTRLLAEGWSTRTQKGIDLSPALLWDGNAANKPTASTRPGAGPVAFPDADSPLQLIIPTEPRQPLTLWNVGTSAKVLDIPLPGPGGVQQAALSADARFAAVSFVPAAKAGDKPGEPIIVLWAIDWKAAIPTVKKQHEWPGGSTALAFSSDGALLATGSSTGEAVVYSSADGKPVLQFAEGELPITALGFGRNYRRPSGERPAPAGPATKWLLAVGSKGGGLSVWDLSHRTRMNRFYGSEHAVFGVAFSTDGTTLASCGRNYPFVWDVGSGKQLLRIQHPQGGSRNMSTGVTFSPDGRRLAFGSAVNYAHGGMDVFRLDDDRGIRTYRGLTGVVEKVWLSPSGKWVAGLAQNWQLLVSDRATGQVAFVWDVPAGITTDNSAVAFDENDTQVIFASGERVSKWSLATGERTGSWKVPLGLNDSLVTRPGKPPLLVRRDPWPPGLQTALRARELGPEGKLTNLYELTNIDIRDVKHIVHSSDGRVLLLNLSKGPVGTHQVLLYDGLTGKPLPLDNAALAPNHMLAWLSDTGTAVVVHEHDQVKGVQRSHVYRLSDLKPLGVQSVNLTHIDDAGKLGLSSNPSLPSENGVALFRVGEDKPVVTFDTGRPPNGNAYGISADGRFVYWGRRDGTVCVADVNKCLEQLNPFRPR